jgi:hypothetical protein
VSDEWNERLTEILENGAETLIVLAHNPDLKRRLQALFVSPLPLEEKVAIRREVIAELREKAEALAVQFDAIDESVYEWQGDPKAVAKSIRDLFTSGTQRGGER